MGTTVPKQNTKTVVSCHAVIYAALLVARIYHNNLWLNFLKETLEYEHLKIRIVTRDRMSQKLRVRRQSVFLDCTFHQFQLRDIWGMMNVDFILWFYMANLYGKKIQYVPILNFKRLGNSMLNSYLKSVLKNWKLRESELKNSSKTFKNRNLVRLFGHNFFRF